MGRRNRLSFQLVGRLAILRRLLMARITVSVRRRPDRILESGVEAAVDKKYLDRPDVRKILVESLSEACVAIWTSRTSLVQVWGQDLPELDAHHSTSFQISG